MESYRSPTGCERSGLWSITHCQVTLGEVPLEQKKNWSTEEFRPKDRLQAHAQKESNWHVITLQIWQPARLSSNALTQILLSQLILVASQGFSWNVSCISARFYSCKKSMSVLVTVYLEFKAVLTFFAFTEEAWGSLYLPGLKLMNSFSSLSDLVSKVYPVWDELIPWKKSKSVLGKSSYFSLQSGLHTPLRRHMQIGYIYLSLSQDSGLYTGSDYHSPNRRRWLPGSPLVVDLCLCQVIGFLRRQTNPYHLM